MKGINEKEIGNTSAGKQHEREEKSRGRGERRSGIIVDRLPKSRSESTDGKEHTALTPALVTDCQGKGKERERGKRVH